MATCIRRNWTAGQVATRDLPSESALKLHDMSQLLRRLWIGVDGVVMQVTANLCRAKIGSGLQLFPCRFSRIPGLFRGFFSAGPPVIHPLWKLGPGFSIQKVS